MICKRTHSKPIHLSKLLHKQIRNETCKQGSNLPCLLAYLVLDCPLMLLKLLYYTVAILAIKVIHFSLLLFYLLVTNLNVILFSLKLISVIV